jgi:predicted DNA-binding protein with PD1-like motif
MDARKHGTTHVVRLDRGEPVLASLCAYVGREAILGGSLTGLGAVDQAELGCWDPDLRQYLRRQFPAPHELVSFTGTISRLDDAPFIHAHVVLGGGDFALHGGHLFEARVAVTGEFVIHEAQLPSRRTLDPDVGLKLLAFDPDADPPGSGA